MDLGSYAHKLYYVIKHFARILNKQLDDLHE